MSRTKAFPERIRRNFAVTCMFVYWDMKDDSILASLSPYEIREKFGLVLRNDGYKGDHLNIQVFVDDDIYRRFVDYEYEDKCRHCGIYIEASLRGGARLELLFINMISRAAFFLRANKTNMLLLSNNIGGEDNKLAFFLRELRSENLNLGVADPAFLLDLQ